MVGFSSKTDSTSGINSYGITNTTTATYNKTAKYTITTNGTHTIYGYVKDNAGHTAKCSLTVKREKPVEETNKKWYTVLEISVRREFRVQQTDGS